MNLKVATVVVSEDLVDHIRGIQLAQVYAAIPKEYHTRCIPTVIDAEAVEVGAAAVGQFMVPFLSETVRRTQSGINIIRVFLRVVIFRFTQIIDNDLEPVERTV